MSKDIRSFFAVTAKKVGDRPPINSPSKRKIASSGEDEEASKELISKPPKPVNKKRRILRDSDSDEAVEDSKEKPQPKPIRTSKGSKLLCRPKGMKPYVQIGENKIPTISKKAVYDEIKCHDDVEFGKTLMALNKSGTIMLYDEDESDENEDALKSEDNIPVETETTTRVMKKESPHKPIFSNKKEPSPNKIISPLKRKESPVKKIESPAKKSSISTSSENTSKKVTSDSKANDDVSYFNAKAWVDRYKPKSVNQIIGQQGAGSNCQKLKNWLNKWFTNHNGKTKLVKPSPWAKNDDGAYFKAALLSGSPGVGKTTTATLVCQELGYDTVEFNASDTRSKKLLKAEVSDLIKNNSLSNYFTSENEQVSKRHVLIMDEVDGMAGNEDRGGIQELIGLIKESNIPIICMCNDRNHPKMRSLVNYCFDLRFNKPRLEQIKGAMMTVCFRERLTLPPGVLNEIIAGTGCDIRQTLNHLSLYSVTKKIDSISVDQAKKDAEIAKKDIKIGPWDVVRKVFSADDHKTMSIFDKSDLFFNDYSISPLFVQENYLKVRPKDTSVDIMDCVAAAANSLSLGDMVDKRIRSNMAWSLLPTQAMFSSVIPGDHMAGSITKQINFPGWLGKYSRSNKRKRLAQEIHDHTRTVTSGSRLSVRMDYAPHLLSAILRPLKEKGADGVNESLSVIKEYRLLREDIESLVELTTWPKKKNIMESVDGRVKAALTRLYNKEISPYSYSVMAAVKKKKSNANSDIYGEEEEENDDQSDEEKEEEEDISNNAFITVKKTAAVKSTSKAKPSTSIKSKEKAAPKSRKPKAK